jgi:hypothetical protein
MRCQGIEPKLREEMIMPVRISKRDFPTALLSFFSARLPDQARPWAAAMLAELEAVHDRRERMSWAVNGSWGLTKIWLEGSLRRLLFDPIRPGPVVLICAYHAIFCCVLLYVIVTQIPRITSSWTDAFFPLLFMVFTAIIPGVIAFGLWVLDDSARYFAMFFTLLHGLGNYALLSTGQLLWTARPIGRIGLDVLILGILVSPPIKRAFRPPPIHLNLDR